jgi:hypothetical protein
MASFPPQWADEKDGLEQIRENFGNFRPALDLEIRGFWQVLAEFELVTSEYMRFPVNWKDRKLVIFNVYR